jgi:RNA polymerase sigma-70 factor, ECF subfamily
MAATATAQTLDDSALVDAMRMGDSAAMSPLYDRYAAGLLGLALRITRERADAEEVVVDAFAQAWRDAASFQPDRGSVAAWLATITRSRALDLMRSKARRGRLGDAVASEAEVEPAGMGSHTASPVADVLADERSRYVQKALGSLPEAQRSALELAYFQGLSQAEIAERLQEPLGTVKTRMRLGLRKLRELLAPMGPGGLT